MVPAAIALPVLVSAGTASAASKPPVIEMNIGKGDWRCELLAESAASVRASDPLGPFDSLSFSPSSRKIEEPVWVSLDPLQNMDLIKRAVIWHEAFGARAVGLHGDQDARLQKLRANYRQTDLEVLDEVWSEIGSQIDHLIAAGQFRLESAIWSPDAGDGPPITVYRYTMFSNVAPFPEFRFATQAEIMGQPDAKYWNLYVSEFASIGAWQDWRAKTSETSGLLRLEGGTYYTFMDGKGVALGSARIVSWKGHQAGFVLDHICAISAK